MVTTIRGITIVGMVCDYDGRHPEQKKVLKIINWPVRESTKDASAFIGLVGLYRFSLLDLRSLQRRFLYCSERM